MGKFAQYGYFSPIWHPSKLDMDKMLYEGIEPYRGHDKNWFEKKLKLE